MTDEPYGRAAARVLRELTESECRTCPACGVRQRVTDGRFMAHGTTTGRCLGSGERVEDLPDTCTRCGVGEPGHCDCPDVYEK